MTITTETLNDFIAGKGFGVAPSAVEAMAHELLANREAQPVGFYTTVSGRKGVIWHNAAPEDDTAIYTAPPAPAFPERLPCPVRLMPGLLFGKGVPTVSMLEALSRREAYEAEVGEMPFLGSYVRGWNDCRAAMLNHVGDANEKAATKCECSSIDYCGDCLRGMMAQPVSSGYKLPDGWKMVPVDPTKEMINAALASGAISIRTAYSAMLAAAPEGGNG
ncbi:hypothetical protein [Serratia nevei]|uniref:hypothetical protein n=1 Tax=Serratia nevei TaxID=2703794 RepID=UPI003F7EC4B5